jgi:hypothetical protein
MISPVITLDQYKSKMGEDKGVVVVAFKANEKMPATDLMEFIEKGYRFVLDADISIGEERDGRYSVFVELERGPTVPKQIIEMLEGISQLCDCEEWNFRYFKDANLYEVTVENLSQHVPLTENDYESKMASLKESEVKEFFNQGAIEDITIDQDNITVSKMYSENLKLKLLALGKYEDLKDQIQGGIQLDENSRNETVYLEKYLGNYEIHKIAGKFLIKNGDDAVIVQKDTW